MKTKSLLMALVLLFAAKSYCAAANDSKSKELTLKIQFKLQSKKMEKEQREQLMNSFKLIFPKATIPATYVGRWVKCCIIDCQKYINELRDLGLEECLFVPSKFFNNKQDGDSIKLIGNNGTVINFVLENGFMTQVKST